MERQDGQEDSGPFAEPTLDGRRRFSTTSSPAGAKGGLIRAPSQIAGESVLPSTMEAVPTGDPISPLVKEGRRRGRQGLILDRPAVCRIRGKAAIIEGAVAISMRGRASRAIEAITSLPIALTGPLPLISPSRVLGIRSFIEGQRRDP